MERGVKFSYSGIDKDKILRTVNSVLPKNKAVKEYGLIFVSKKKMAELNKKYRRKSGATNVLSFETGDVVLCPKVADAEAKSLGFTQKKWMTRLVVHGILHLAGYDHDTRESQVKMDRVERTILKRMKLVLH